MSAPGSALGKRVKEIADGEQPQTQNSACEINVVTNAVFGSPAHRRKKVECFADMSKHDSCCCLLTQRYAFNN
jgi:hypothetical protein